MEKYRNPRATEGESIFYSLAPIFVVSTKCIDLWVLEFVVLNITDNNQWENSMSLDFNSRGLSVPRNPPKIRNPRLIMISQYFDTCTAAKIKIFIIFFFSLKDFTVGLYKLHFRRQE